MKTKIEVGDVVRVDINNALTTVMSKCFVQHIPQATGDCWQFCDFKDCKNVVYISEGCTVTLLDKAESNS